MQKIFFAELKKVEDVDDGSILVTGIASTESPDSTGETILASAIKKALPAYKRYPAIREMHRSTSAAGRAVEISVDDDGITHLTAHIVDVDAIRKVKAKVYGGFSVGGRVVKRDKDDRTIITEIALAEISLVDRPAHPEAAITMWKADAGGADDDDLTKVPRHLDGLAKQLAERDRTIIDLADRLEKASSNVAKIVNENAELKKQMAELRKPAVLAVDNGARQINKRIGDLEAVHKACAEIGARLQHLERGRRCDA